MFSKFLLFLSLVALFSLRHVLAQSSEKSNTGGAAQSGTFSLTASIGGQASPISSDSANADQVSLFSGYIFTLSGKQPPSISHTPISVMSAGQNISVEANINDDTEIASVVLKYRRGGETVFLEVEMSQSNGAYHGTIDGSFVTDRGVEYKIEATDLDGLTTHVPSSGIASIQVEIDNLRKANPQPSGDTQNNYRLISIPIDVDKKTPADILVDELGSYNNTRWRFFELLPNNSGAASAGNNQSYAEFPNTSEMRAGKAFWLIVKEPNKHITTGAGKSNKTSTDFAIDLNTGWNFIGNPFNFNIPINKVRLESGAALDFRQFDGTEFVGFSGPVVPFEGYAVHVDTPDRLLVNPQLGSTTTSQKKDKISGASAMWVIGIEAHVQQARDTQTFAIISSQAATGWDDFDRPEAPTIGDYVSIYFPHPEWGRRTFSYTTDARPEPVDGEIWEFEVRSNIHDKVTLTFDGLWDVPHEYDVWLLDETLGMSQNLRQNAQYSFVSLQNERAKRFQLIVGKNTFIEETIEPTQLVPHGFELAQNFPNPFNPGTSIRYGIPAAGRVTLKIFNLLGEEVVTLVNEEKPVGYHIAVWDGRDRRDRPVAGGVYVYQIRTKNETLTKRMILLR